jgi:hypothetical protein
LGACLVASHLIHGLIGHRYHAKPVITDLRLWQGLRHTLDLGCAHVLTKVCDLLWFTAVSLKVLSRFDDCLMVFAFTGKQQALILQVMHHGYVILTFAQAGLVYADDAHC